MKRTTCHLIIVLITTVSAISTQTAAVACTRALYVAKDGTVLTGRSMDWGEDMHLAISDSTGDSAIFEYVNGKLVIHHGKEFKVLTNSPTYDQQLAIMEYWKMAGGLTKALPGTSNAADRFVRASFLLGALPVETSEKYISGSPQQKFHSSRPWPCSR